MIVKYRKRCENSLVMQDMQINISKITTHFTLVSTAKIKKEGYCQALVKVWGDIIFCTISESVDQSSHSGKQAYVLSKKKPFLTALSV